MQTHAMFSIFIHNLGFDFIWMQMRKKLLELRVNSEEKVQETSAEEGREEETETELTDKKQRTRAD